MAKGLNKEYVVNLAFTADTNSAKQNIQSLSQELQNLVTSTSLKTKNFGIDKDLQSATASAAQLKVQLEAAVNTDTGKLDLSKFSDSLKKSGMTLEKYQNQLYQLGPEGQKAFSDLSKAITLAEVPLKRSSTLMQELWTTMKNTARWQLTSSAMHSFMGAIQHAYYYAQDLNESLNNIRIVSGASVEQMDKFAEKANKAAKSLSSTTLDYTNAALIYYQQGLTDKEVADRTEVTLKMANAANESATTISEQLTSVWNNFYDGSESLEHYADAMVRLGADTASSSSEISEGLQKFSSVAGTIGLSFDNAAAALATITATTRESADVVGTALKTLFSRIQGLNLGQTLDDGTDLNKYSTALHKVGIEIKDTDGELKDMDDILDEMGTKWNTWSRDTQTALAQTVAGVRQYTQLMTLMNNYDFYKENVERAKNSEGSLQEQADIYAESWEAAKDRVKASAEAIYKSLINDQFFIEFNNGISTLLEGVNGFIKGMGGVKGLLLSLGSIVTRVFSKQIAESFSNLIFNIKGLTSTGRTELEEMKKKANKLTIEGYMDTGGTSGEYTSQAYSLVAQNQLDYLRNVDNMSEEEQKVNQILMDRNRLLADSVVKRGEELEKLEEQIADEKTSLEIQAQRQAQSNKEGTNNFNKNTFNQQLEDYKKKALSLKMFDEIEKKAFRSQNLETGSEESANFISKIKKQITDAADIDIETDDSEKALEKLQNAFLITRDRAKELQKVLKDPKSSKVEDLFKVISGIDSDGNTNSNPKSIGKLKDDLVQSLKSAGFEDTMAEEKVKAYTDAIEQYGIKSEQARAEAEKLDQVIQNHGKLMDQAKVKTIGYGEAINKAASAIMAMGQIYSQITGIIKTFNDENTTTEQKIGAIIGGIGMLIPALQSITSAFSKAKVGVTLLGQEVVKQGTIAGLAMWQFTLIVMGIAAALGIVIALIDEANKKSPEGQLKKAKKAVEELTTAEQEAKDAADNLRSSIESYDSAVEKLQSCKRGTEEWRDALLEANEAAVNVLNAASGLSGEDIRDLYSRNSDGLIEFNKEGLQTLQNQADENAQLASYSLASAQYNNSQAQNNRDAYNLGKQIYDNTIQYDDSGNTYSKNTSKQIQQIILDNLDNLSESMPIEDFKNNLLNLGVDLQNVTNNELTAWQNSIKDMANEADKASAKLELVSQLKADEILGDNYNANEKDFAVKENVAFIEAQTEFYKNVMGHNGSQTYTNQLTGASKTFEGISAASGTDNKVYQYILKALQDSGRNVYATSDQSKAVQGTDTNRSFEFIENSQAITMTRDEIANMLAASDAIQQMGNSANKARQLFSQFSADSIGKVTTLVNDFNQKTKEFDVTQLMGEWDSKMLNEFQNAIGDETNGVNVAKIVTEKMGLTPEEFNNILDTLGVEDAGAQFGQAILDGLQGVEDSLNPETYSKKWRENSTDTEGNSILADSFDELLLNDDKTGLKYNGISSSQIPKFAQTYEAIFNKFGTEGLNVIDNLFNQFGDDAGKVAGVIGDIDWSSDTSLKDFQFALNNVGVTTAGIDLSKFITQMDEIYKIADSDALSKAQSNFKEINDIVKNLKLGDTISPENYAKLGNGANQYFTKMADGTYKLTTDAKAFYDIVMRQRRDEFTQAYKDAQSKATELQTQKENATQVLQGTTTEELGKSAYKVDNNSYDGSKVKQQLNFLQAMGYDQGKIDSWTADAEDGQMYKNTLNEIAGAVRNMTADYENLDSAIKEENNTAEEAKTNILTTVTSIKDLKNEIASNDILEEEDYGKGLSLLASQYEECEDAYINYVNAVEKGNPYLIEQAKKTLEESIRAQEVSKLGIETLGDLAKAQRKGQITKDDINAYDSIAKKTLKGQQALATYNKEMTNARVGTDDATKAAQKYKKAIEEIEVTDLASDINNLMTEFSKLTKEEQEGDKGFDKLTSIAENLKDIFGADFDYDANFVKGHWDLIKQYLTGTLEEQRQASIELAMLGKTTATTMTEAISNSFAEVGVDANQCTGLIQQVESTLQNANFNKDGSISLNTANAINNLIALQNDATQVAGILNSILNTNIEFDPSDFIQLQNMLQALTDPNTSYAGKSYIKNVGIKSIILKAKSKSVAPAVPGTLTGPTGSGGGSQKEKDTKDWNQDKDRYHDYDKAIDQSTRNVNKLSKAVDRLYGASKVSAIQKQINALKEENKQYEKKLAKAKEYLTLDKQALQNNSYGYQVSFNQNGFVNLEQTLSKAYEDVKKAQEAYNKALTDDAKKVYDKAQEKFENFKKLIEQYEETLELIQELEDQIEDNQDEIMAKNYEKLTVEVEYKVQLDENELKKLDYFFNKLSDNIYKAAEAFGYLQGQIDPTFGKMSSYEDFYNNLESSYANGEITQADYVDGLQNAYDSILDNLQAVQDLDKEMLEYYGNTLDLAEDELSKYTDQMEHLTSVLDHYRSILSLLGRDTDYTRVLSVLEGNAQTKRNKFDTSKAWYESLKAERDAAAAALAQASDDAERELLQKNYDAIVAKFNEAEEQMLSDAEAYGEAIKEVLTTKMEQAADNMNKAMTDGMGWDVLNDSLDRLSKYQDEYLTKTNQIYEMNKLLNDVNKASNKTNNQAAKDKYYQFSKEIEQLKEKDKLSQLELDIAQAKYKVLQAQIALDEAQNAMGKVRLQRDNEGNFGYVYTADQDKIDDAQQALADAENDLYNIRLNATNKYGQQKLQYEQELAEKLKEIDEKANEDALYREGNYQTDRQRIIDEYTQLIQASSDLYKIAQEEDSRVIQDAWVNAYDEIIDSGDQWKTAIIDYTDQINNAFQEWQAETDRLTDLVGKDLVDTKNKVNDVTNASDQLKDEVISKVVPALNQELQAVRNATEAYARQRQEIITLISYYEQLINKIQQAIAAQASMDVGSNSSSPDYDDYDPSVDYSALMGTVPVGSELYNKYKAYRDRKISEGNYNDMASTSRVNAFYEKGYTLGQGPFAGYSNFTQIPDWLWKQTVGFRTGGYTGQWGDSGKLAMLHEKELVLNKEDTQNMLSSIKMVREIASEIDLRSRYTTMPINPIYSTFGTGNDILEQQVHIDASFPNVTDRNEIQEAFNTLINVASQYANRK